MPCIYSYELLLLIMNRCLQMHTAVEDIDGLDDVENSILYYNQAVIHYHMRQYSEAISIGEKLYQFLEPFGMFQNTNENCYGIAVSSCSSTKSIWCSSVAWLDGFLCPRRKVCSGRLLPVGGSVSAHLPAREGTAPAGCAGEAHRQGREQQKRQRRGERCTAPSK